MTSNKFIDVLRHKKTEETYKEKPGADTAVLAYHAGTEKGTGEIAEMVHGQSQSSLYKLDTPLRVPSTKIRYTQSGDLTRAVKGHKRAVTLHKHKRKGLYEKEGKMYDKANTIFVTGQNADMAEDIGAEFEKKFGKMYNIETNINYTPKHLQGISPDNIGAKFEEKAVQIEFPKMIEKSDKHKRYAAKAISKGINNYKKAA
ncbi:MAG: hypothetical protein V3V78_00025 [Candidatus Woesearchaeota archaeon]